jgi:foldase protein PrsA
MHFKRFLSAMVLIGLALIVVACGGTDNGNQEEEPGDLPIQGSIEFSAVEANGIEADQVVATYEGGEIKGDDFLTYLAFQAFTNPNVDINAEDNRREFLQFLILQRIISTEHDADSAWAENEADMLWDYYRETYGEETVQNGFQTLNINEDVIKDYLNLYFLTESYFRTQIDEQEAREQFELIRENLITASVRHILIKTHDFVDGELVEIRDDAEARQMADDVYQELQGGTDFAQLAMERSEDEGSSANGGLYADMPVSGWVEAFKRATMEQEIGVIGEPVQTEYGYHIIRVEDRQEVTFEDMQEDLYGYLAMDLLYEYFLGPLQEQIEEINI